MVWQPTSLYVVADQQIKTPINSSKLGKESFGSKDGKSLVMFSRL